MSKAKELRDKFNKDLKELQDNCPHLKIRSAPHMIGNEIFYNMLDICVECDLIVGQSPPDGQYELMLQS